MSRPAELSQLFASAECALRSAVTENPRAAAATDRIFSAIAAHEARISPAPATRLPVLDFLGDIVNRTRNAPSPVAQLASAMLDLSPSLVWNQRAGASRVGEPFLSGHANTLIAGVGGYEERSDVIVGGSLLAPGITYPEHKHAPEEMHIVISGGDWYNELEGWYTPPIGGVIYHRSWLRHAMRSSEQPLLTVWCLYVEPKDSVC